MQVIRQVQINGSSDLYDIEDTQTKNELKNEVTKRKNAESEINEKIKALTETANNKVEQVEGKQLSTNDFTDTYKNKLDNLNNYDDTELTKRVSTVESTLPNKLDKENGKQLSTNDFTNEYKNKLDGLKNYDDTSLTKKITSIESTLPNKVDVVTGKQLSTNDYTNEEKEKLGKLNNYDDSKIKEQVSFNSTAIENLKTDKLDVSESITDEEINEIIDNPVIEEEEQNKIQEDINLLKKYSLKDMCYENGTLFLFGK